MLSEERKIKTRAQLKEYLDAELGRYPLRGRRYLAYMLQISEGAILRRHQILLRKTEYFTNTGKRLRAMLYYAMLMKLQNRYSLHIPINTCGKGLSIPHLLPLGMNGEVTVGENCRVHVGSYLTGGGGSKPGSPVLGDNVVIGIGAIVTGGVTIADNITIAAGAVVTRDFLEPGVTIAGVPAKKIRDSSDRF